MKWWVKVSPLANRAQHLTSRPGFVLTAAASRSLLCDVRPHWSSPALLLPPLRLLAPLRVCSRDTGMGGGNHQGAGKRRSERPSGCTGSLNRVKMKVLGRPRSSGGVCSPSGHPVPGPPRHCSGRLGIRPPGGEEGVSSSLSPFPFFTPPPHPDPPPPPCSVLRLSSLFAFLSVNKCLSDPPQGV